METCWKMAQREGAKRTAADARTDAAGEVVDEERARSDRCHVLVLGAALLGRERRGGARKGQPELRKKGRKLGISPKRSRT